ncbi:like-Sm domain-containing protein [Trichoderma velutinum]
MCFCYFTLGALSGSFVSRTNTNGHALQVLKGAVERIIRTPDDPEPSAEVPLGLYLVRGDNVCSVGLVDETLDESIDWTQVKGTVIGGIKHI